MNFKKLIRSIFSIKKWSFLITTLYIKLYKFKSWKKDGIIIAKKTVFIGVPILTKLKNSVIEIGEKCLFVSNQNYTALGVAHKVIIRTLRENAQISIGDNVRMSGTTICSASKITIGDRCVIGADVIIADTDFHSLNPIIRSSENDSDNALSSPVTIGKDVFIGGRSVILKGVTLGNSVIVGAGSVVTKSFESNSIIAGNPAKLIKKHLF
jgi:acetyltransferase-like isoleucine patch superfamily enzyme